LLVMSMIQLQWMLLLVSLSLENMLM
jgi:hypothetical protein